MIVSPARMLRDDGFRGTCNATYFSPNNVFGTIRAVTFAGITCAWPGKMPSLMSALDPSLLVASTCPTSTPRIFTSARVGSWRPTREDRSCTSS